MSANVSAYEVCAALFESAPAELQQQQCETNFDAIWQEIQQLLDIAEIEKQVGSNSLK